MSDKNYFYLLRHGTKEKNPDTHHSLWELSESGKAQAVRMIPVLLDLGIDTIISSPFPRCLQTIEPFATKQGLSIETDTRLQEKLTSHSLIKNFSEIYRKAWTYRNFALAGTESARSCLNRFNESIKEHTHKNPQGNIVFSTHGHVISFFLNMLDPNFGYKDSLHISNPQLFRICHNNGKFYWSKLLDQQWDPQKRFLDPEA